MSDHFTKQVGYTLFSRHNDYIMGRVPPQYSPCYAGFQDWQRRQPRRVTREQADTDDAEVPRPVAAAAAKLQVDWQYVLGGT